MTQPYNPLKIHADNIRHICFQIYKFSPCCLNLLLKFLFLVSAYMFLQITGVTATFATLCAVVRLLPCVTALV